ncbi:MAG TPA: hypothetical protein VHW72_06575 [Candidatus Angelobacter sp.]|nr:hypothetical protein [Candidatus Angelobacter sp.]
MNVNRLKLETTRENLLARFIDLLVPIGQGQGGLISGPRHTGQKLILETIANSVAVNHPEVIVMVLLLGQNEDEAAAVKHSFRAEVFFSTPEELEPHHIHLAENVIAKAKCLVEEKRDVLVLVDSLTRLAQSYNEVLPLPNKTGVHTLNPYAVRQVRRFFEATGGRDAGGSFTIMAIAEVETLTLEEGMLLEEIQRIVAIQVVLESKILQQGIYPAVNLHRSRNKEEEMVLAPADMARIRVLRKVLAPLSPVEAAKLLGSKLLVTPSNSQFLSNMSSI